MISPAETVDMVDASGLSVSSLGDEWPQFRHPTRPEFLQTLPHVHGTSGFFIARLTTQTRIVGWNDWIRTSEVEPSIYAADFARLGEQLESLVRAGVRIFHYDIGDGHFIEPITIGPIVLQSISKLIHDGGAFVDCHLMTETPEKHFKAVAEAGGDSVTVHYEACPDLASVVSAAREQQLQIGLAFKPATSAAEAAGAALKSKVDLVLCMSIEPGYSGQAFMPEALDRIRTLRSVLPPNVLVQVDGGIGPENVRAVYDAGARLSAAGTSIFGRDDLPRAYRRLA